MTATVFQTEIIFFTLLKKKRKKKGWGGRKKPLNLTNSGMSLFAKTSGLLINTKSKLLIFMWEENYFSSLFDSIKPDLKIVSKKEKSNLENSHKTNHWPYPGKKGYIVANNILIN